MSTALNICRQLRAGGCRSNFIPYIHTGLPFFLAAALLAPNLLNAAENKPPFVLQAGKTFELLMDDAGLPPTLYSMMSSTSVTPCVTFHLPEDYTPSNTFPLVLYVPGFNGGRKGNIQNAQTLAGPQGWIAATLPLFKKTVDRNEVNNGIIISFEDYPVVSQAYRTMLGRLFETVPNIDPKRSAMVGFSNGAITVGMLVSNHDEFVLSHFRNFCLVDHGMFHLADLHKSRTRESRFLILAGDQPGMGRDVIIRQGQLQQDAWKLLNVEVSFRLMENTGHEFKEPQMAIVRNWLQAETAQKEKPPSSTAKTQP